MLYVVNRQVTRSSYFMMLNIQRVPKRSLQVPQYPQNSSCGGTPSVAPSDNSLYNRSASSLESGFKLIVRLLPAINF